jgi:hypothetical protein
VNTFTLRLAYTSAPHRAMAALLGAIGSSFSITPHIRSVDITYPPDRTADMVDALGSAPLHTHCAVDILLGPDITPGHRDNLAVIMLAIGMTLDTDPACVYWQWERDGRPQRDLMIAFHYDEVAFLLQRMQASLEAMSG